ncbi:hypothetical protein BDR25DRAFT_359773 [Lindgomyces ingoldianus]|uniref:Uncharacterized protein n=1 Tax=Lindgomyces ingoldianus TaxID=673940 RepID=A0ACB6QHS9_9PLEO|nr:hypothetical protein BDR25DRAFT_359773 [Lindgomyces ingoldianus]
MPLPSFAMATLFTRRSPRRARNLMECSYRGRFIQTLPCTETFSSRFRSLMDYVIGAKVSPSAIPRNRLSAKKTTAARHQPSTLMNCSRISSGRLSTNEDIRAWEDSLRSKANYTFAITYETLFRTSLELGILQRGRNLIASSVTMDPFVRIPRPSSVTETWQLDSEAWNGCEHIFNYIYRITTIIEHIRPKALENDRPLVGWETTSESRLSYVFLGLMASQYSFL